MSTGMLPSEAFAQVGRGRLKERNRAAVPFGEFATRIPEPDVGKLDMRKFPFQREILFATGALAELVLSKGTQVGMSSTFIRWVLWVANELSGRALYVMPTQDLADDFSDDRVKRLMEQEALAGLIPEGGTQNKRLKRIGRGLIYFRGSMQATSLDNIPARALVLDEYDTLNQDNIPVAEQRVGAQDHPMIRRLGVPSLQGYGIDKLYRATDMRRWLVKCGACGAWQRITWANLRWEELGPQSYRAWRVCVECEAELENLLHSGAGEWVAEYPDRPLRGYHVPRLLVPGADMGKIVKGHHAESQEAQQEHYNRDLAEPFETPEQRLSAAAIESCRRPGLHYAESYIADNPVTMGIDQASTRPLTVRISEHLSPREKRTLALLEVPVTLNLGGDEDPDTAMDKSALRRLAELMQVYKVQMACIDHAPDGIFARAFCAAHLGRAYMVAFNTKPDAKNSIVVPKSKNLADMLVVVKRTEWITLTLDSYRWQRNLLPREQPLPTGYEEQLRNVVKQRHKDAHGRESYGYDEHGPVDWLMAELYDQAATEVLKHRLMEGAVTASTAPEEVQPPHPTPDLSDWEGKPWEQAGQGGSTYGEGWDSEYRP